MINPYDGTFVMGGDTNGTNSAFNSSAGSLSIESIYFDIDRYGIRAI